MSRELDAMQFVLDLLTDGIITSAVQQIGHTPHDRITEDELPFVQVYSPIDENQEQTKRQPPGVLTFQLDILDVFGNSNVLRTAIAALDETLRIDNTMQGLVENAFITLRSVAERKNDERSVVGAVITVQILEGTPEPVRTSILSFADSSLFEISGGSVIENSKTIDGAVGVRKTVGEATTTLSASDASGSLGFPMDLSALHRLRLRLYQDWHNLAANNFNLRLHTVANVDWSEYRTKSLSLHGWRGPAYDLDDPATFGGSGVDLSDVVTIQMKWAWFPSTALSDTYGIIVLDLGYTQRDTGLTGGYDPGF
jgi:hypothetical protein